MTICDLQSGLGQIAQAHSQLRERWHETKEQWRDQGCQQFEETHLSEIPARLQLLLVAAQRLAEVVEQAERECGDRDGG